MQLNTFKRILFLDHRPNLTDSYPLAKFRFLLLDLEEVHYKYQPLYEVEKDRILSVVQEYYQRLIDNASINFFNEFQAEIRASKTREEKQYIIRCAIKQLNFYMLETLTWNERNSNTYPDLIIKTNMKHQLVRLYLEVMSETEELPTADNMDEVYQRYFNEPAPVPSVIHDATTVVRAMDPKANSSEEEKEFQIRLCDFRPEAKGILSYDTIIKNPKRFAEFEEHLFLYGFIDEEYNFTNKHGMKSEMAEKYHQMIKEGYFFPRDFKRFKDILPRDIRKFLDHRYQVNLDKLFRSVSKT